ncbi:hypothetical protein BAY61_04995 [Prauserella marina]|uniref:Uncharacterized protein n=1 Tax=Prauserella marina TaxID=530584 RepID=A0A222VL20_9PSEU|nr:hypothetical protein [Prauserella marina]ASR34453.1 hypothetical protein BAY61_04995 [Prauserella marina]PWV85960.1 hypothetical protein DES30_1011990 [Prauserella marina]SDC41341.1 hypothetical protein SAMN05421630_1022 [Prauserella marina]
MNNQPEHRDIGNGWKLRTRIIAGTAITVLSNDPRLGEAILATARPINTEDHYGCPPDHPATHDPSYRPTPPRPADSTHAVESISICHYTTSTSPNQAQAAPLIASARTTGNHTQNLLTALRTAPTGSGPNEPGNCAPEASLGNRLMVLRLHFHDEQPPQDIVLRYSGCVRNGTDDGHTPRHLTRPLLTEINNNPTRLDEGIKPVFDLTNQ